MKKYKVEVVASETFVIDVLAENQKEAEERAMEGYDALCLDGLQHYHSTTGDVEETIGSVYDVTETEDPFSPLNA